MMLAPMSENAFYAVLLVAAGVLVSMALAQPVFGPLMHSPAVQDWLREVVVPALM